MTLNNFIKNSLSRLMLGFMLGAAAMYMYTNIDLRTAPKSLPQMRFIERIYTKDEHVCSVRRTLNDSVASDQSKFYASTINAKVEFMMRDVTRVFSEVLNSHNITYFMTAGSLLGSYLHHGLIPWDDDLDFIAPLSEKKRIIKAFESVKDKYTLSPVTQYWKFFSNDAVPFKQYKWSYPYIDLIFYKDKGNTIQELHFIYDKNIVFPLVKRPFWDMELPAPKNTEKYLKTRYNLDKCPTNPYNHTLQSTVSYFKRKVMPCKMLYREVTFVFRCTSPAGSIVNETLWVGDRLISWVVLHDGNVYSKSQNAGKTSTLKYPAVVPMKNVTLKRATNLTKRATNLTKRATNLTKRATNLTKS